MLDMADRKSSNVDQYEDKLHNHDIVEKLNQMRANGTLIDIWPVVDGMEFAAHSTVLASCSDYFMAMCESNMIPLDHRVRIKDISASIFQELLDFMYTGKVKITQTNVEDLLRGSSMLLLEKVRKKCCTYLNSFLNDCNCLGILSIADELSCEDLANRALKFTQQYFADVWLSMEFVQLPFHLVLKLVESDATSIPSEDIIYAAVVKWISFDDSRVPFFEELFLNIRLRFVSEKVFEQEISQNKLVTGNPLCLDQVKEVRYFRQDLRESSARRRSITSYSDSKWLVPRLCMSEVKVIVAVGGVNALIYNAETNEWVQLSPVTTRHCPGMGVMDNDLIIVGGSREWKRLAAGVRYDPKRSDWLGMVALNQNRSNFELLCLDGYLYAVGGYDGESPLSSVERFNPKHNKWEFVAAMNHARDGLCVVTDDEYLYAISGYDGERYLSSIERYDPEKNMWEMKDLEPIKQYRECASSVISDGKAYVIGGYFDSTFLSTCEVYDIDSNTWSDITPMNAPRYQTGAAVLNRWIFVCGGWTGNSQASSLVECYHIDEDCWFKVASLPTPCTVRCAALMFPRKQLEKIINSQEEIKKLEARTVAEDLA